MAEGGIAAAMGNVDDRDNWRVHFADTMRGGQYLNNPRMAELHAKEAPDRVRELEAWGAVFDRTKDGRILQRNFGGHRYPRLAHVGDRTGLEMIRTLQDHGIHQGIDVHMECTVITLLKDGGRVVGAFWLRARARALQAVPRQSGGAGHRRHRPRVSKSPATVGSTPATATRSPIMPARRCMDMEFVQFHPTGMIWPPSVRGILVTEGVRGEGGVLRNKEGKRFMFDDIPANYKNQTADNPEEGWRYTQGDKNARRPPELLTRDHVARCIVREVREGRGSPHGGVFLDIAWIKEKLPNAAEHIKKKLPSMYHQFKQLADIDITKEPMEIGPTTHYMMGGVRVDGDTQMSDVPGLFAAGECGAGLAWRQSPGRQFALRSAGLRQARRRVRREVRQGTHGRRRSTWRRWMTAAREALEPFERQRRKPVSGPARSAGHDAGPGRHRAPRGRNGASARTASLKLRERAATRGSRRQSRIQSRLAHRARSEQSADRFRSHHARGARAQGKPRRAFPRRLSGQGRSLRQHSTSSIRKGTDGEMQM